MFYLTVHDIVWLNSQLAGRDVAFDYETLEAAVAAQYGYGDSRDVMGQAAEFAEKLLRSSPFQQGNLATGLLCVGVYLLGNGVEAPASGAGLADTVRDVRDGRSAGAAVVAALAGNAAARTPSGGSVPGVRAIAARVQASSAQALGSLKLDDGPVEGWAASPHLHRD